MSTSKKMSDIQEQKRLLVAKADLQRSSFLLIASPVFKIVRAIDVGYFAYKTGKALSRHFRR